MEYNIENEEGILIQGKINCSKLKKRKLKTKKSLKITILGEQEHYQQTEPKQSKPDVEEICIYQNLAESDHHSIYIGK